MTIMNWIQEEDSYKHILENHDQSLLAVKHLHNHTWGYKVEGGYYNWLPETTGQTFEEAEFAILKAALSELQALQTRTELAVKSILDAMLEAGKFNE